MSRPLHVKHNLQ